MEPIRLTSRPKDQPVEYVTFFELDGREYKVPKEVGSDIVLAYLQDVAALGTEVAIARAFVTLLGQKALRDLRKADVPTDQLTKLMTSLERHMMGPTEGKDDEDTSNDGSAR